MYPWPKRHQMHRLCPSPRWFPSAIPSLSLPLVVVVTWGVGLVLVVYVVSSL